MKQKIIVPVALGALVLMAVAGFGVINSVAGTVHAQSPAASVKQVAADKETQDDVVSPKPAQTVQEKADTSEKDQQDSTTSPEVEDGK